MTVIDYLWEEQRYRASGASLFSINCRMELSMSEESHRRANKQRSLKQEEMLLLTELLKSAAPSYQKQLSSSLVEDMDDGDMGGIKFINPSNQERSIGAALVEAQYTDQDGVLVSIIVNADTNGNLYELDFWKVDFTPLLRYPTPDKIVIIQSERTL